MTAGMPFGADFGQGLVDVHGAYRSQRLVHERPDELVSDTVTMTVAKPHILRFSIFFVTWFALMITMLAATVLSPVFGLFGGGGFIGLLGGLSGMLLPLLQIAWLVSLFLPIRETISEYGVLVEDRGDAAANAYGWIWSTAARRQAPFPLRAGKVAGLPVLEMQHGRVKAVIIVRPVGSDLYVGWSMWRHRSTMVLLGNLIRDSFESFGGASAAAVDIRTAGTRALRELVHSLTREGIQVAVRRVAVEPALQQQITTLPNLGSIVTALNTSATQSSQQQPQPPPAPSQWETPMPPPPPTPGTPDPQVLDRPAQP